MATKRVARYELYLNDGTYIVGRSFRTLKAGLRFIHSVGQGADLCRTTYKTNCRKQFEKIWWIDESGHTKTSNLLHFTARKENRLRKRLLQKMICNGQPYFIGMDNDMPF